MDSARGRKRQQKYDEDSGHDSDVGEYKQRRQRNNVAVQKSREKSRALARQTAERVTELRRENDELEGKVGLLSTELKILKDVLLTRAGKKRAETSLAGSTIVDDMEHADHTVLQTKRDAVHEDHIYVAKKFKH